SLSKTSILININGVEGYIGILEVVGNAIVEDYVKMIANRDKILKAMRLALFQLEQTLRNNGISDENQFKHNLETFGILVDKRDFIIYAMHYDEGVYLVDEIDLSLIIPDTSMPLFLIEDIIKKLLAFRHAHVEYLNTWIKTQLRETAFASRRHLRRITTAVDSPQMPTNIRHRSTCIKALLRNRLTLAVAVDLLTLPKFFMRLDIGGVLLPLHLRRRRNFMRPDIGDKTMSQWISKLSLGSRQPLISQSLCQEKLMHNSFTMYTHD
ncbi:15419_t:CDS:2, partial [Gigaspora margarita]